MENKQINNESLEKIASFRINHLTLMPGLYVSRKDSFGSLTLTTFDMRFTAPNREPPVDMPALHTIEHLAATYLRSGTSKDKIVYFGPMGCRTGCYLILAGDYSSADILPLVLDMCDFIISFDGEIPGAKAMECGNYLEQNLTLAKYYALKYKNALLTDKFFTYPD